MKDKDDDNDKEALPSETSTSASASASTSSASIEADNAETAAPFDKALQEGKLRQAVQYLQDHPDMPVSRQRFNDIFAAIEERTAGADEAAMAAQKEAERNQYQYQSQSQSRSPEQFRPPPPPPAVEFPLQSAARQEMTDMYRELQKVQTLRLFGAVNTSSVPPAAGSTTIPPRLLEQITDLPMTALTPQPTNTLLLAGIALAASEAWLSSTAGIPLNLLALATLCVAVLDNLAFNGAVSETVLQVLSPGTTQKVVRHEAGHFLVAYLLGCPVEGIVLSAWAALQDRRFGRRRVSAGTSFFDPDLAEQINTKPSGGAGGGGIAGGADASVTVTVTRASIDRYSVIVMAGIAAEADFYGQADGGAGDEMALVAFLSQLNPNPKGRSGSGGSGSGAVRWDNERIRNQARWGALQAVLMMRAYQPAYDALVDALERGGSLGDCVYAIESAAREHNLQPLQQPVGYIVDGPLPVPPPPAGSTMGGEVDGSGSGSTWTTVNPATTTAAAAAAVGGASAAEQQQLAPATEAVKFDEPKTPFNEEESLAALKGYRTVAEQRLKELDEKLKDIQD